MIIETSSNQFFRVTDAADIDHAWIGIEVKCVKGNWETKSNARQILVRKTGSRIVEAR